MHPTSTCPWPCRNTSTCYYTRRLRGALVLLSSILSLFLELEVPCLHLVQAGAMRATPRAGMTQPCSSRALCAVWRRMSHRRRRQRLSWQDLKVCAEGPWLPTAIPPLALAVHCGCGATDQRGTEYQVSCD